jgi:hypothetical protein
METDGIWSSRVSDDFTPDGDLEKRVWTGAQKVRFDRDPFQRRSYPEIETSVATLWTPEHLYLAYWCNFVDLHIYEADDNADERWGLWHRDVVEAFIAPSAVTACHYYEFEVAPNNQWLDLEIDLEDRKPIAKDWNSGFLHAVRVDEAQGAWTAEMRIPAETMGIREIDPDSIWRINFCRSDGPSSARRLLSWRSLDAGQWSFHQPARFGMLRFAS